MSFYKLIGDRIYFGLSKDIAAKFGLDVEDVRKVTLDWLNSDTKKPEKDAEPKVIEKDVKPKIVKVKKETEDTPKPSKTTKSKAPKEVEDKPTAKTTKSKAPKEVEDKPTTKPSKTTKSKASKEEVPATKSTSKEVAKQDLPKKEVPPKKKGKEEVEPKKSKPSPDDKLINGIEAAKKAGKFYCVNNNRIIADSPKMREKYDFYKDHCVAGIPDSPELDEALNKLSAQVAEPENDFEIIPPPKDDKPKSKSDKTKKSTKTKSSDKDTSKPKDVIQSLNDELESILEEE